MVMILSKFCLITLFYRYKKALREYGVDISTKSPKEKSNIIPLVRYLEAKPVGIPDWAYEKGLVA